MELTEHTTPTKVCRTDFGNEQNVREAAAAGVAAATITITLPRATVEIRIESQFGISTLRTCIIIFFFTKATNIHENIHTSMLYNKHNQYTHA